MTLYQRIAYFLCPVAAEIDQLEAEINRRIEDNDRILAEQTRIDELQDELAKENAALKAKITALESQIADYNEFIREHNRLAMKLWAKYSPKLDPATESALQELVGQAQEPNMGY